MISVRYVARSIPRLAGPKSTQISTRTFAFLHKSSTQLSRAWIARPLSQHAAFSTAMRRYQDQAGSVDGELSAKLASEHQLELDASAPSSELPPHLREYLDSSPWELTDNAGEEEVTLTRTFGKEHIKVTFTVADLNLFDADPDAYADDPALYDEDAAGASSMQQGGAQSKGTGAGGRKGDDNIAVTSEDRVGTAAESQDLPADDEMDAGAEHEGPGEGFPARLHITVTKDGVAGALHIESVVRDGEIVTENVHFFPTAELADARTAEQDWSRRNIYTGPPFGNLDEDLQVLIDRYVQERGVDTALAVWVPDYVDFKEQREYVGWLDSVKNFVDA